MHALADGTRIERVTSAKLYRDTAGRIRREQTILGLAALNLPAESQTVVTVSDPVAGTVFSLNPATREARRIAVFLSTPPPPPPPPPPPLSSGQTRPAATTKEESLGSRQIEGVMAVGRRITTSIPIGQIGNDRPIEITEERWESPELRLLVLSRRHDPQSGDIEYRLTNIRRAEPSADVFKVPADYTVVDAGPTVSTRSSAVENASNASSPATLNAPPRVVVEAQ